MSCSKRSSPWSAEARPVSAHDPAFECLHRLVGRQTRRRSHSRCPGLVEYGEQDALVGTDRHLLAHLLLGLGDSLSGTLLLFDALSMHFQKLKIRRDPHCPVCGDNPTQTGLIDYEEFCGVRGKDAAAAMGPCMR